MQHLFNGPMAEAIVCALKQLLSEKHLYQQVSVDLGFAPTVAQKMLWDTKTAPNTTTFRSNAGAPTVETMLEQCKSMAEYPWTAGIRTEPRTLQGVPLVGTISNPVAFELPTINTFCDPCDQSWPFNPVVDGSYSVLGPGQNHWYHLVYQCQQCKGPPIRFMVRREGLKLRLVGRDPLEVVPVPKVLPKAPSKYFSDAVIAHHAGQTLAGLFLLRVFVEQFWRSVPEVQQLLTQDPRATGEKQGDAYQATLPADFKSRFPSLSEIYGKLSAAIHAADSNADLFQEAQDKIIEHFDARRLFKIFVPVTKDK